MSSKYIEVDLEKEEKEAILKYASSFTTEKTTNSDLLNRRKKWVRFNRYALLDVIGELSYHFNRCKSDDQFYFLDQLISHLEYYHEKA